jgi:predicted RNA-binding protein YlxR (DUF448 family)
MSAGSGAAQGRRRNKGPRPKHVPQRMCIVCRDKTSKRALTRIVRTPEGPVAIDPSGKRNGRGAYLCDAPACWDRATTTNILAQALKSEIDTETADMLRAYAANLPKQDAAAGVTAEEGKRQHE